MNRVGKTLAGIAAGVLIGMVAQAGEKDKKVKKADLPVPVQATADRESAGARVTGYTQGTYGGRMIYEVEMVTDGVPREVLIGLDGTVVAVANEVAWDQVPADVQGALKLQSGDFKMNKVNSISQDGKVVGYESWVTRNGKMEQIHVGVDGKTLTLSP